MGFARGKHITEAIRRRPLVRFVCVFVISVVVLLGVRPIGELCAGVYLGAMKSYVQSFNKSKAGERFINVIPDAQNKSQAEFEIQFVDRRSASGEIPARALQTDFRREAYLPFALLIALFVALPIDMKSKYKKILFGSLVVNIYIFTKLFAFIFDNYNYPDMVASDLPFAISWIVYAVNAFVNTTGFSTTIIVPIVIWFLLCQSEVVEITKSSLLNETNAKK